MMIMREPVWNLQVKVDRDKKDDMLSGRFGIKKEHGINLTINIAEIILHCCA